MAPEPLRPPLVHFQLHASQGAWESVPPRQADVETPGSFDEMRGLAPCLVSARKGSDTRAMRTDEGIELSLAREALQFVKSTVRELEPRPVD